ncbi:MAG: EutN/CcmL family microcompartment protein [Phycisphaerae bacterium]|nr:EutN/CcmL family microcompartment protein [Phycisphaerae bacterium]
MYLARVIGNATSTIKHVSLTGWRMLVVAPVKAERDDPLLAIDSLGAGIGDLVIISNDGKGARDLVGDEQSPARWTVLGIVDDESETRT